MALVGSTRCVNPNMGWPYVLFNACLNLAAVLTWQTTIQRVLAARDAGTGRTIYVRTSPFFVAPVPHARGSVGHRRARGARPAGRFTCTRCRASSPASCPAGLMGLLVAAMLAADMSTDSSYMLTWASVIYNDILAPLRRRKWSDREGLRANRFIVAGIGVFLLVYGLWYPLQGRPLDLSRSDRHDLPRQHVGAPDRGVLLEARQQLGSLRGDRRGRHPAGELPGPRAGAVDTRRSRPRSGPTGRASRPTPARRSPWFWVRWRSPRRIDERILSRCRIIPSGG